MTLDVMQDLTEAEYYGAGVSKHQILQMHGMADEQRIRFLGVELMTDVVMQKFTGLLSSPHVRGIVNSDLTQHLKDCDINRRLGHLPPL